MMSSVEQIIEGFKKHDRRALAKAITLIENEATYALRDKERLFEEVSSSKTSIRIAISGPPGVGKSSFINALGKKLLARDLSLAILAVDPSSKDSKGSILADKTRMTDLVDNDQVYIRPSPSKKSQSGIALTTHDVMVLVEAFGFDVVIIETVGVGQAETVAQKLCDHFVVLVQPGSGDQIQAMKMGIVEKADFLLVTKADDEFAHMIQTTKSSFKESKNPRVRAVSAHTLFGVDDFVGDLLERQERLHTSGQLAKNRQNNLLDIIKHAFEQIILEKLYQNPAIERKLSDIEGRCQKTLVSKAVYDLVETLSLDV